jgi:hypothetical protein
MAQLADTLRCKPEGRKFESASNRNEYKSYFFWGGGVKVAGAKG